MSKLVFDATGKYVHPTRYRQIVETASTRHLSSTTQSTITEDQKHSSVVARVHYQKQRSREVASKAHKCLEKLHGDKGTELEMEVRSRLSDKSTSSQQQNADQSDSSLSDEADTITKTQTIRLTEIGTRRRKTVMFTPE